MLSLSIVIPAYNEAADLAAAVDEVSAGARRLGLPYEIIVVNDGSRDATGAVARALAGRIPRFRLVEHYPNRGYGGALKAGFAAAQYEWIAFIPADRQFVFHEIRLLAAQAGAADIVSGYRADRRDPFLRKLNGLGWNLAVRLLFDVLSRDIDCGFKLFRRSVLSDVTLVSDGAMIDTELLAGARARGYRVAEVAVTHLPRAAGRPTGANPRVIARAFRDLLRFRLRLSHELREARRGASVRQPGAAR